MGFGKGQGYDRARTKRGKSAERRGRPRALDAAEALDHR